MPEVDFGDLPLLDAAPADDDELLIRDVSASVGSRDKRITVANLAVAGADGADGADGSDGVGVPTGGTTGQVLAKASATDFDTEWVAASGGGVDHIWLSAGQLVAQDGSPVLSFLPTSTITRWPCWRMDASSNEIVGAVTRVPTGWTTVDIYVWISNVVATSGDISHDLNYLSIPDTESADAGTSIAALTAAAPAQHELKRVLMTSGVAVTGGDLFRVSYRRRGPDAGDTLAGDSALCGIEIVRAS